VYGIKAARLLFWLGSGTGEPKSLTKEADNGISTERTSELSNPLCADFFLGVFGAD
jgi:hypothetical protein